MKYNNKICKTARFAFARGKWKDRFKRLQKSRQLSANGICDSRRCKRGSAYIRRRRRACHWSTQRGPSIWCESGRPGSKDCTLRPRLEIRWRRLDEPRPPRDGRPVDVEASSDLGWCAALRSKSKPDSSGRARDAESARSARQDLGASPRQLRPHRQRRVDRDPRPGEHHLRRATAHDSSVEGEESGMQFNRHVFHPRICPTACLKSLSHV